MYTIYKIFNKTTGKSYVGSTKNPRSRWRDHKSTLNRKRHSSRWLQADWELYGEEDFVFEVLEDTVLKDDRFFREQHFMDIYTTYDERKGYNVSPTAEFTVGRRHTDEARRKMSVSHSGKKLSAEHRRKQSIAMKSYAMTDEHRRNLSLAGKGRNCPCTKGSKNGQAKFTESQVLEIKTRLCAGETVTSLAKEFGVRYNHVYQIKSGRTWNHVDISADGGAKCLT
ncbi:GIY-YIG nuclease family protein [Paenibacillus planticolens]